MYFIIPPKDKVWVAAREEMSSYNIEQLVKCMENPRLNYDREYNPHEYLSHSVLASNCKLCHIQCLATMSIKRI